MNTSEISTSIAPHVTFHSHTHLSRLGTKRIGKIGIGRLRRGGLDSFFHGDVVEWFARQTNNLAIERVSRVVSSSTLGTVITSYRLQAVQAPLRSRNWDNSSGVALETILVSGFRRYAGTRTVLHFCLVSTFLALLACRFPVTTIYV